MSENSILTPIKAIRAKCLDCCCGDRNEVKLCPSENCSLYPYRFGKNPNIKKRELTDEERSAAAERLRVYRQNVQEGLSK